MTELTLLLFSLIAQIVIIIALYQLYLVPKVIAPITIKEWEKRMYRGDFDIPAILEDYTATVIKNFDALLFGFIDDEGKKIKGRIQKFYEGAAGAAAKQLSKTEGGAGLNLASSLMTELSREPWYIQAIAQKLLPALEEATSSLADTTSTLPESKIDLNLFTKGLK